MLITSESVKVGHPDVVCDSIAANIIAAIIDEEHKIGMNVDNMPHCGIEIFLGKGLCIVGGEVATRSNSVCYRHCEAHFHICEYFWYGNNFQQQAQCNYQRIL
jgi:S-adenosylmethionine synthetase